MEALPKSRLLADFADIDVGGIASYREIDVDGELRFSNGRFDDQFDISGSTVSETAAFQHTTIAGDFVAADARFGDEVDFEDLQCTGDRVDVRNCVFEAYTSFSLARLDVTEFLLNEATFEDEAWFVHGRFSGSVDATSSRFAGQAHFRDADFEGSVSIVGSHFEDQVFLHGSTIDGDLDARGVTFEKHFQFSATVTGNADFGETHFDAHSTFRNGAVHGKTTFDGASFAGSGDFTDTRFKGPVTVDGTEFYARPDFEGTRFAVPPNLDVAVFPHAEAMNLPSDRRIVVARSEKLENIDHTIPFADVQNSPAVPPAMASLVEPEPTVATRLTYELKHIDAADWYQTTRDALELARTAVAELESSLETNTMLVFGFSIGSRDGSAESILDGVSLVGVYAISPDEDRIRFSHLSSDVDEADHLIAIPATDDAFESGPSVGTHGEYCTAMLRRQALQASLLQQDAPQSQLIAGFLPVLVASARVDD
ncbi:pentapeptide repeat-containing protein [Halobacteria archaeon AArc-m2/3/4]|uniref:Pentapeptide repeat-containing protein n=1 Tax=Natronoglomus mannanivorans TaxID=2979990 RepID=A0ABT2QLM4_9EURY|nr:pentapeptide repeat-containing protein [Halobacteria archaeon AArc-m2/3/4]